jgi:hypothetical protein
MAAMPINEMLSRMRGLLFAWQLVGGIDARRNAEAIFIYSNYVELQGKFRVNVRLQARNDPVAQAAKGRDILPVGAGLRGESQPHNIDLV